KMAVNSIEEDEYIDMEITSFSNFLSNPRNSREFEFQMSSLSMERQPTTSLHDQLFYKGKLLPLLENQGFESVHSCENGVFEEFYGTPLATATVTTPTTTSTPFESCNISPRESCLVSRELNSLEYSLLFEYSNEIDVGRYVCEIENPKKPWTKKLKLSSRLKTSKSYLNVFLGKSGCSNETSAASATKDGNKVCIPIPKSNQSQLGRIDSDKGRKLADNRHRRSFSMAIKRFSSMNKSSTSSSSSSSLSSNSNGFQYLQFLRRSSSVNAEMESPIQGAIAHCKRSPMSSKRSLGDGLYSLSASNIAVSEGQERPDLWRG
ncbi:probable membrane-associated kinase regulator 4, partial [Hibiscus syriacus]|uniref:probable membrane-associated kinase regulator 4 n=1 Tax=Hibiscus syriacus TaxID=106335 RepID=UPI0019242938